MYFYSLDDLVFIVDKIINDFIKHFPIPSAGFIKYESLSKYQKCIEMTSTINSVHRQRAMISIHYTLRLMKPVFLNHIHTLPLVLSPELTSLPLPVSFS